MAKPSSVEKGPRKESNRSTNAQRKLRLTPEEAAALDAAAKAAHLTLRDYVLRLHCHQPVLPPSGGWKLFDEIAELQRAIVAAPDSVRKLDADLGRLSGRLKDLFTSAPIDAMRHQDEINAALRSVRSLREEIMPILADLQEAAAAPRDRADALLVDIRPRRKRRA